MVTLKSLMARKLNATELEREVIDNLIYRFTDYTDISVYIKEILQYGCISGAVGNLIYYHDTLKFYEKHKVEINSMLYETMQECSQFDLSQLFHGWDKSDPLAIETTNRNLLAWYGFEECLYRLALEWEVTY